jgi:hypothetical protein
MTAEQLVDLREAERDAALDVLERLVQARKGFEFSTPREQAAWRDAKAMLVEHGRKVNRERL